MGEALPDEYRLFPVGTDHEMTITPRGFLLLLDPFDVDDLHCLLEPIRGGFAGRAVVVWFRGVIFLFSVTRATGRGRSRMS
jgi:hypothetical protein